MAVPKRDQAHFLLKNNVKIWRLMGVAACTVNGATGVAKHSVILYLAITIFTFAIFLKEYGTKLLKLIGEDDLQDNPFRIIAGLRSAVAAIGFLYQTTIHLLVYNKRMVDFFNCFNDLELRYPQPCASYKKQMIQICLLVSTVLIIGVFDITFNVWPYRFDAFAVILTIIFTYPQMAPDARLIHFLFSLKSLEIRASNIHANLLSIDKDDNFKTKTTWLVSPVKRKAATADQIKHHRQHWAHIMQGQDQLNSIYGGYLLVLLTESLLEAVFGVFLHITIWQMSLSVQQSIGYVQYTYFCFTISLQVGRLLLVVISCNSWFSVAENLERVLNNILEHIEDDHAKKEVKKFQSHLHCRRPIISAAGFVDIHFGYLYDLIGSVAMYIIILLQFKFETECTDPLRDLTGQS